MIFINHIINKTFNVIPTKEVEFGKCTGCIYKKYAERHNCNMKTYFKESYNTSCSDKRIIYKYNLVGILKEL